MVSPRVTFTVSDPFEATLLTYDVGERAPINPPFNMLAVPPNVDQCVHVDVSYVQKKDAPVGVTIPFYKRCSNSTGNENGWLCGYHERRLLTPRLTVEQVRQFEADTLAHKDDDIAECVILTDARALKLYPHYRYGSFRLDLCPTPPRLTDPKSGKPIEYEVRGDWERVALEADGDN